jgi:hypothetical protein
MFAVGQSSFGTRELQSKLTEAFVLTEHHQTIGGIMMSRRLGTGQVRQRINQDVCQPTSSFCLARTASDGISEKLDCFTVGRLILCQEF